MKNSGFPEISEIDWDAIDPNLENEGGQSLFQHVRYSHPWGALKLISRGANVDNYDLSMIFFEASFLLRNSDKEQLRMVKESLLSILDNNYADLLERLSINVTSYESINSDMYMFTPFGFFDITEVAKSLVEKLGKPKKDNWGGIYMTLVLCNSNFKIADYLISEGFDLKSDVWAGVGVIHKVCRYLNYEEMEKRIQHTHYAGREPTGDEYHNYISRVKETRHEEAEKVLTYIGSQGVSLDTKDNMGWTPLHWASFGKIKGNAAIEALVKLGAPINAQNVQGETPLHIAYRYNYTNEIPEVYLACERLLHLGADFNIKNNIGDQPQHTLTRFSGKLLRESAWTLDHFKHLSKYVTNLKARTSFGENLLHLSAIFERLYDPHGLDKLVQFFLDNGIHIDDRDEDGGSVLHSIFHAGIIESDYETNEWYYGDIRRIGDRECQEDLWVECPEEPEEEDETHPFINVLYNNLLTLLEFRPNPNLRDEDGNTPLHLAVIFDYDPEDFIEALIKAGADTDLQNGKGDTPLHVAAVEFNLKVISKLLEHKADGRIKNHEGKTPFMCASKPNGNEEKMELYWKLNDLQY